MNSSYQALIAINSAFYDAFSNGNSTEMSEIWSQNENISCIHPGWGSVVGRIAVIRSWQSILANPPAIRCASPQTFINDHSGYVICFEEMGTNRLIATNIFHYEKSGWKLVHHQAGVTRPIDRSEKTSKKLIHWFSEYGKRLRNSCVYNMLNPVRETIKPSSDSKLCLRKWLPKVCVFQTFLKDE